MDAECEAADVPPQPTGAECKAADVPPQPEAKCQPIHGQSSPNADGKATEGVDHCCTKPRLSAEMQATEGAGTAGGESAAEVVQVAVQVLLPESPASPGNKDADLAAKEA